MTAPGDGARRAVRHFAGVLRVLASDTGDSRPNDELLGYWRDGCDAFRAQAIEWENRARIYEAALMKIATPAAMWDEACQRQRNASGSYPLPFEIAREALKAGAVTPPQGDSLEATP